MKINFPKIKVCSKNLTIFSDMYMSLPMRMWNIMIYNIPTSNLYSTLSTGKWNPSTLHFFYQYSPITLKCFIFNLKKSKVSLNE